MGVVSVRAGPVGNGDQGPLAIQRMVQGFGCTFVPAKHGQGIWYAHRRIGCLAARTKGLLQALPSCVITTCFQLRLASPGIAMSRGG